MILSIGEALIDMIAVQSDSGSDLFRPVPGGSPYNTAISLSRLEVPTAYFCKISRDMFGDRLVSHLDSNGVATDRIIRSQDPSTLAFVSEGEDGSPRYAFFTNGTADRSLSTTELSALELDGVSCVQCGSISLILEPGASIIESFLLDASKNRFISFDPNIRTSMIEDETRYRERIERIASVCGLVKTSDEDLRWIYPNDSVEESAQRFLDSGAALVVVTEGINGARAFPATGVEDFIAVDRLGRRREPGESAVDYEMKGDSVGAGDTFHAALLSWLYRRDLFDRGRLAHLGNDDLRSALGFAAMCATITCSRVGADPPRLDEISDEYR